MASDLRPTLAAFDFEILLLTTLQPSDEPHQLEPDTCCPESGSGVPGTGIGCPPVTCVQDCQRDSLRDVVGESTCAQQHPCSKYCQGKYYKVLRFYLITFNF